MTESKQYVPVCLYMDKLYFLNKEFPASLSCIKAIGRKTLQFKRSEMEIRKGVYKTYPQNSSIVDDEDVTDVEDYIQSELEMVKQFAEYYLYKCDWDTTSLFDDNPNLRSLVDKWLKERFDFEVGTWEDCSIDNLPELKPKLYLMFNSELYFKYYEKR